MFSDNLVFSQIMDHLPWLVFHLCVAHYYGDKYIKTFNCTEQCRCIDFALLTCRSSLRDIEIFLRSQTRKLYQLGIQRGISRNNLADEHHSRGRRIFTEFPNI